MLTSRNRATGDPIPVPFTLAIDTRESHPWSFEGLKADADQQHRPLLIKAERRTLQTGDYSIVSLEHELTIERKSAIDLFSTLAHRRANFKEEHERMMCMVRAGGYACVIIEDDLTRLLKSPPPQSDYPPKSMFRTFIRWSVRYDVPWYFAGSRSLAEVMAFRLLETWFEYKEGEAL